MNSIVIQRLGFAFAAAACAFAGPASAQDDTAKGAETTERVSENTGPGSDELICRVEKVIGSLAKRRKTCLTRAEWEEVASKGNAFAHSLVEGGRAGRNDNN